MRHLAYFIPFRNHPRVTYLLIPLPFRGRQRLETVQEDGTPGQLYCNPAQVLPVQGGAVHRVLLNTLRREAESRGYSVPADVATPAAINWSRYSSTRNELRGHLPDGTAKIDP